jgi:hypothetical protein
MSLRLVGFSASVLGALLCGACTSEVKGGAFTTTASTTSGTGGAGGGTGEGGAGGATCAGACTSTGALRCTASAVQRCEQRTPGCLAWGLASACPGATICNAVGIGCVLPQATCASDADCGCGCGCVTGACACTGVLPSSCAADADCGPPCAGRACVGGACEAVCLDTCPSAGAGRCVAGGMQTCAKGANGCLAWKAGPKCPGAQTCDANGAKCTPPSNVCTKNADCGCGCVAGACTCTGAIPASCTTDADCGPPCTGLACIAGVCTEVPPHGPGELCIDTGGTIALGTCCLGTQGFPNSCAPGPCSCSPDHSHTVKICACPAPACFDPNAGCTAP